MASIHDQLRSDAWPAAVPDRFIARSETDKWLRAEGILDLIGMQNRGRFLDFGCGEGHVALAGSLRANCSVGYDPIRQWVAGHGVLTTDLTEVTRKGPYDVILLYDVLDHAPQPLDVVRTTLRLLKRGGELFALCHPWTSRTGGHLYTTINKAYAHMVLTDAELTELALVPAPRQPSALALLQQLPLSLSPVQVCTLALESFFLQAAIADRLHRRGVVLPDLELQSLLLRLHPYDSLP